MKIYIKRLENTDHEYFAYLKGLHGKGTYLLYFNDDIYGALALSSFIQMLRGYFKTEEVTVQLLEKEICIHNQSLLSILQSQNDGL